MGLVNEELAIQRLQLLEQKNALEARNMQLMK